MACTFSVSVTSNAQIPGVDQDNAFMGRTGRANAVQTHASCDALGADFYSIDGKLLPIPACSCLRDDGRSVQWPFALDVPARMRPDLAIAAPAVLDAPSLSQSHSAVSESIIRKKGAWRVIRNLTFGLTSEDKRPPRKRQGWISARSELEFDNEMKKEVRYAQ
jgi:hypothetical protein